MTARLDLDLPVRQPFNAPGVFHFLAVHAIKDVDVASLTPGGPLTYARTLALPHGPAAFQVTATETAATGWHLNLRLELTDMDDVGPAVARVRRLFDLDADPAAIDAALATDPVLAPLVERTPGIRVPGTVDPHELVVWAIVGQQISVAAARTHLTRMAAWAGSPYVSHFDGLNRLFPTPAQIADRIPDPPKDAPLDPDRPMRLPGQSIRAIVSTARALANGELDVRVDSEPERLRADLVSRPRIGPWTASYIAMRVIGDPDSWLTGDVALVAGAKALGLLDDDASKAANHRALATHATAWTPWRSYAAMHLWQAASARG
ncbi:DNA-3-methyladenine glycosylase 2 family protein [Arthrobacter roseus]|uniref:DNA-3-methyladenine glycosylase 2 family protein n=1 Tax=Arthrobacter roseus TaxID=136274 RepID=UPI001964DDF8|nr:3-methyladenine DNA glycosylase/8-oxoguanine DNA glycosylase [Arthrobacter roseus]